MEQEAAPTSLLDFMSHVMLEGGALAGDRDVASGQHPLSKFCGDSLSRGLPPNANDLIPNTYSASSETWPRVIIADVGASPSPHTN